MGIINKIIVCIKQVPDTTQIEIDPVTKTLKRTGQNTMINPYDLHAIEAAIQLKEAYGFKVVAISMGPPAAAKIVREAFAYGVDEGYLLTDKSFAGSDTLSTAKILASVIRGLPDVALVLTGLQSIDGDTGQVGPEIAAMLDIPNASYVNKICNIIPDGIRSDIVLEKKYEEGILTVKMELPAVVSVDKIINIPRTPSIRARLEAKKKSITILNSSDVDVKLEEIGIKGSPTQVIKLETMTSSRLCSYLNGDAKSISKQIIELIRRSNIIDEKYRD